MAPIEHEEVKKTIDELLAKGYICLLAPPGLRSSCAVRPGISPRPPPSTPDLAIAGIAPCTPAGEQAVPPQLLAAGAAPAALTPLPAS